MFESKSKMNARDKVEGTREEDKQSTTGDGKGNIEGRQDEDRHDRKGNRRGNRQKTIFIRGKEVGKANGGNCYKAEYDMYGQERQCEEINTHSGMKQVKESVKHEGKAS